MLCAETTIEDKVTYRMPEDSLKPPRKNKGDAAHMLTKAVLSAIPVAGGPAAEFFAYVVEPSLSKRRAEWEETVTDKLNELEDKVEGFHIKELAEDPSFITSYINATRLAISEHRIEKLAALRNAVLNSALSSSLDDDTLALFLNYIDRLTPWHLRLLSYFGSDHPYGADLTINIPELRGRAPFYGLLVEDLINCGLLYENLEQLAPDSFVDYDENDDGDVRIKTRYPSGVRKSARTLVSERIRLKVSRAEITTLGRSFLSFITSPIPDEGTTTRRR